MQSSLFILGHINSAIIIITYIISLNLAWRIGALPMEEEGGGGRRHTRWLPDTVVYPVPMAMPRYGRLRRALVLVYRIRDGATWSGS